MWNDSKNGNKVFVMGFKNSVGSHTYLKVSPIYFNIEYTTNVECKFNMLY